MGLLERDKEEERGKRGGREERETNFFILFDYVVYIILISCM